MGAGVPGGVKEKHSNPPFLVPLAASDFDELSRVEAALFSVRFWDEFVR